MNWFPRTNKCSLGYKRTVKPNPERKVKGRLNFSCIYGLDHYRKGTPKSKIKVAEGEQCGLPDEDQHISAAGWDVGVEELSGSAYKSCWGASPSDRC